MLFSPLVCSSHLQQHKFEAVHLLKCCEKEIIISVNTFLPIHFFLLESPSLLLSHILAFGEYEVNVTETASFSLLYHHQGFFNSTALPRDAVTIYTSLRFNSHNHEEIISHSLNLERIDLGHQGQLRKVFSSC